MRLIIGWEKGFVRGNSIIFATSTCIFREHASEHPFFEDKDTSKIGTILISISDDGLICNGLGSRRETRRDCSEV